MEPADGNHKMATGVDERQSLVKPQMKVELERDVNLRKAQTLRTGILIWLTMQNSVHTLLIRYSRARTVEKLFLPSVAVFFTELFKIVFCILIVLYEEKSVFKTIQLVKRQVFENTWDTVKVCLPAMIYTIQNNLFYLAATHLEAATFMITSQLKIFTTAIFSVIMLSRPLSRIQWLALGVLFTGVSLVQVQHGSSKKVGSVVQRPFLGFAAVVIASILSGFAGIYFEKILKGSAPVSLWMRNIQMAMFAIPSSLATSLLQDWDMIRTEGMLYGFDTVVWITVFWYCIGGLSVAVCIRYADNIAKNFATSVAIILSTIGSVYIFGFVPNLLFIFGATLVIGSIFLYSSTSVILKWLKLNEASLL